MLTPVDGVSQHNPVNAASFASQRSHPFGHSGDDKQDHSECILDVLDGSTVPATLYFYTLKLRHVTTLLL